jgi:hypothetical protein
MPDEPPDWVKATTPTPEEQAEIKAGIARVVAQRVICATCGEGWVPQPGETGCPWCAAAAQAEEIKHANGHKNGDIGTRKVNLTAASGIKVRPVRWVWEGRIPLGSLTLLGGREGIGKSTMGYTLAADVTRGELDGIYKGQPKSVIVAATEDSWEMTIVPRLMAAGADLSRVYRVDVTTDEGLTGSLTLPLDLLALEAAVKEVDAALILLDPLMSRLSGSLDTHKDADVRKALEPLTSLADRSGAAVLGLIHVNKGAGTDPLTLLMGSRAFAAVARAVLFVMVDPEDEGGNMRLLGTPKNNLGRTDLPTLAFIISPAHVATTEEGEVWTGRLDWKGESERSIDDAMASAGEGGEVRTATTEAAGWLEDYLMSQGGSDESALIKREGAKAGHQASTLARARQRLRLMVDQQGYPRRSYWTLPIAVVPPLSTVVPVVPSVGTTETTDERPSVVPDPGGRGTTETTETTVESGQSTTLHSHLSHPSGSAPREVGTTEDRPSLPPNFEKPFG